jgi:DNA polymerase I-like protein with 3'-5' exonuclease and polymerase domains
MVKDGQKLKDHYAIARQAAKAVNFGVPAGLGAASLVAYARRQFKADLTHEEAQERRERLRKVYQELDLYLAEDGAAIVARNLRAPLSQVRRALGDLHLSCIDNVLAGNPVKRDGTSYKEFFVDRIWADLAALNHDPELKEALEERRPSQALARKVCQAGVTTLTGRIRGGVRYTQARNTPFQGLAADGAALALFGLVQEGFRVVAFVHDEVLVELPDEGGYVSAEKVRRVEEIMCREMEKVLVGGIPAAVESKLARRWCKKAGLVIKDGKAFPDPPEVEATPTSPPRSDTGSVTPAIISPGEHPEDQPP